MIGTNQGSWLSCFHGCLPVLAVIGVTSSALAQQPASPTACNNLTRTAQITAGYHNSVSDTCQQITISVGGSSFSTPSSCTKGYAYYGGTVYSCGPTAQDLHCTAQGFKVPIELAQNGGCPDLSGLNPGSWATWADVPKAIANAMKCVPPKVSTTHDWSASCTNCTTGAKVIQQGVGSVHQASEGESYLLWEGDPTSLLPVLPRNPFQTAFDLAQDGSPSQLPDPLRTSQTSYGLLEGVAITAEVRIDHFDAAGVLENRRIAQIQGNIAVDGRFDLKETLPDDSDGQSSSLISRLAYDGSSLFVATEDAETANVYGASYTRFDSTFSNQCAAVAPLFAWLAKPCEIPLFASAQYSVGEVDSNGRIAVSRLAFAGEAPFVGETWLVDGLSIPRHPLLYRTYDLAGNVRDEIVFESRRTIAPDVWRPTQLTRTMFLDGSPSGRKASVSIRIVRARTLAVNEPIVAAFADDQMWYVWR